MRQSKRRREFNLNTKDVLRESIKNVRKLIKNGDKKAATEAMRKAMSALDKAVKKHVIHKNTAARRKSRMAKAIAR